MNRQRPGERDRMSYTQDNDVVREAHDKPDNIQDYHDRGGARSDHVHHGRETHPGSRNYDIGPEFEGERHRRE
jgi:hypothetical protein